MHTHKRSHQDSITFELGSIGNSNLEQHACQDHIARVARATVAETTVG